MLDSAYEPVRTRAAPLPSVVHPSACQPAGRDEVGDGEAELLLLLAVVDVEVDEEVEDEVADEADVVVPT